MHPKFIITTERGSTSGLLRMGLVTSHRELVVGYEKVHGGGWWEMDEQNKVIRLYGASGDYGEPDFRFLRRIPKEYMDYTFLCSDSSEGPWKELDKRDIEWGQLDGIRRDNERI